MLNFAQPNFFNKKCIQKIYIIDIGNYTTLTLHKVATLPGLGILHGDDGTTHPQKS